MPSPTKKRKAEAQQTRGLEFFFKRQKARATSDSNVPDHDSDSNHPKQQEEQLQSDEELARKLQAEWNAETAAGDKDMKSTFSPSKKTNPAASEASGGTETPIAYSQTQTHLPPPPPKTTLTLQSVSTPEDIITASLPLDENPLTFTPSDHIPKLRAAWEAENPGSKEGASSSYALLTRCFTLVSATSSRIKIINTITNTLRILIEADPSSLLPAVWLTTNAIAPSYEKLELGIGASVISKALKTTCGLDGRGLKALYDQLGDPGDVAFEAAKKKGGSMLLRRPRVLTIRGAYGTLVQVARAEGKGSVEVKQKLVDKLLLGARGGEESRYLVRTLCQNLRIGAVRTTLLTSLSRAFLLSRPPLSNFSILQDTHTQPLSALPKESLTSLYISAEEAVKATFARRPNYNDIIPPLLSFGPTSSDLARECGPQTHIPIVPMLGSPTRDLAEVVAKVGTREFAAEWKYDGQRAQVHYSQEGRRDGPGNISIFSRHLEDITLQYPDVVSVILDILCPLSSDDSNEVARPSSFVLEGEIVAISSTNPGQLLPFQTLSSRARKAVDGKDLSVNVCLFAFDLMFLDSTPLLAKPFRERRDLLRTRFKEVPGRFQWVRSIDAKVDDEGGGMERVMDFFKEAVANKCEGLMVKLLDDPPPTLAEGNGNASSNSRRKPLPATYHPDKRGDSWLKVKKDYDASAADTLDLVPIAAWHGSGRKANWWSPILLAVRREEDGVLEAVCKCMSGFTDKVYKDMRAFYDDGAVEGNPLAIDSSGEVSNAEDEKNEDGDQDEDGEKILSKRQNTVIRRPALIDYSGPEPDVWFRPCEVWEIAFADITLSPTYTASIGLVSQERGLSLRFPRYLRKRDDKGLDEASSDVFLAGLWRKQDAREKAGDGDS